MRKLTHATKVIAALGLLALLLATSAFTLAPSKAFAATTHTPTHLQISEHLQPLCGTYVQWDGGPTSVSVGSNNTWYFGWACAGASNSQNWIVDWRDGNTSSLWCFAAPWVQCGSGEFSVDHDYGVRNTFVAKVYNAANSGIAAWYTIKVV